MARAAMVAATEDMEEAVTAVDTEGDSEEDTVGVACLSCGPRCNRRPSRWCPRLSTCQLHRRLEEGEELLEVNRESATGVLQFFRERKSFLGQFFRKFYFSGVDSWGTCRTTVPTPRRRFRERSLREVLEDE